MKINRMWAVVDEKGKLRFWMVMPTRRGAIEEAEKRFALQHSEIKERYGYRIEKVVVLRADDFEAEIKAAREEVLELACGEAKDFEMETHIESQIRLAYQERFGHEQPEVLP